MKTVLAGVSLLLPLLAHVATAAPKKPQKTAPGTLGRYQLAGDNGKFGTLYTVGKANPLNVAVNKASYTLWPGRFGIFNVSAKAGEKLLRIDFTAHNPTRKETTVWYGGLKFTVIGTNGQTYEMQSFVGDPAQPGQNVEGKMLPAQRIKLFCLVTMPAQVGVQKLVARRMNETPVLRFTIGQGTNKITPFPAPFAAGNGGNLAVPIRGEKNVAYPLTTLSATFLESSSQHEGIGDLEQEKGKRLFVVKMRVKNISASDESVYGGFFKATLKDTDGETYDAENNLYGAKRDEPFTKSLAPSEEVTFRLVFRIHIDATIENMVFSQYNSNTYSFEVG